MRSAFLIVLVGLVMAKLVNEPVEAQESVCPACPAILIDHQAFSARERQLLCEGGARAREFFRSHGVELKDTIHVSIHDAPLDDLFPHIGSYSLEKKKVRILGLRQSLIHDEEISLFGLPLDDDLYRSIVVHEIAHAIANQNFEISDPSVVAQEYLAYIAQLSTMEPRVREKVLGGYAVSAYKDIGEMSPVYYAIAPGQFGIKAYLHFLTLTEPSLFIRGLLSGSIKPAGSGSD